MRVHIVDPSAFTPPYDAALCDALAAAGADVELYTSRFSYGEVPRPAAAPWTRHDDAFYRRAHAASGPRSPRARRALKLAEHVPGMLRYRRGAARADVVHFQWLTVQHLDRHLLPRGRPLVLTAHDVLPREPRAGQVRAQKRLYDRFDALVAHGEHARARLIEECGVDAARVQVIPHGPLSFGAPAALPGELHGHRGPVALFFGLLRPYKGLDVLLDAWRSARAGGELPPESELWVVGMPRGVDVATLRAASTTDGVRLHAEFVPDAVAAALFARADAVVLPYLAAEQSGVAFAALGHGTPLICSDVGDLRQLGAAGAARVVPRGDPDALASALIAVLGDPQERVRMADAAGRAAAGPHSWSQIATRTLHLYEELR